MTKPEIAEVLTNILLKEMDLDTWDLETNNGNPTLEEMGLDSLQKVELTMFIEDKFHIDEVEQADVPMNLHFEELVDLIYKLKN